MIFTQEQVDALGFVKVDTTHYGVNNEIETTTFKKGFVEIGFYNKNGEPYPFSPEVTVGLRRKPKATLEDLKALDKLFNRCASQQ